MELYLLPFYAANILLLGGFPSLLLALWRAGQAALSLETQILILLTFLLRYTDLYGEWQGGNSYRLAFKTTYISLATINVVVLTAAKIHAGRRCAWPSLLIPILVVAVVLALPLRYHSHDLKGELLEFSWATSQYLGGLSILPQLIHSWSLRFLHRQEDAAPTRVHRTVFAYLYLLLAHQLLYVINWILRYFVARMLDPISIVSGSFRLVSLVVFLVKYAKRDQQGQVYLA